MTTEHKHAEVLRAIADGKVVQWLSSANGWLDATDTTNPLTYSIFEWRVKPEPKPDVVRYWPAFKGSGWSSLGIAKHVNPDALGFASITIDGETGKLKSVEIVE